MNLHPAEPHLPTPLEDTACTRCEGDGRITEGRATRGGKTEDIAHACPECDGSGSGYTQWANGCGPHAVGLR